MPAQPKTALKIIVIPVANIEITPENPMLCPGESVQLTATADQAIESWEWSPTDGLSCSDCPDPTATPPGTITYQVQGEFMGCPSTAQVTVEVFGAPQYAFPSIPFICLGDDIILNEIVDPNATYEWLNPDGSLLSNDAQPSVSPTTTTTYSLSISLGSCPPITDDVTITVQEDYTLTVGNDLLICEDEEAVLTGSATDPSVVVTWMDDNGNTVASPIPANSLAPGSTNIFTATAADPAGCFSYMDEMTVEVYPDFYNNSQ